MTYNELTEILLSNDVYNKLKQKENELFELIPELKECYGFNQNNKWHIYDVYEHILHVVSGVDNNKCLRIAALFHDIGKPPTYTVDEDGIGHFYNHWNKSLELFEKYQNNFELSEEEIILISNLIFFHDINVEKLTQEQQTKLMGIFGFEKIGLLFNLKRADLLAQSPEFHKLITLINAQEQNMIRIRKF